MKGPPSKKNQVNIPQQSKNRILPFVFDFLTSMLIMTLIGEICGGNYENEHSSGTHLEGTPVGIWMLTNLLIWPISEGLFGQTLGKRLFKTKVISDNGDPISMRQAFIRFLFLVIDITPIGIIASSFLERRIGDWFAKTTVIDL